MNQNRPSGPTTQVVRAIDALIDQRPHDRAVVVLKARDSRHIRTAPKLRPRGRLRCRKHAWAVAVGPASRSGLVDGLGKFDKPVQPVGGEESGRLVGASVEVCGEEVVEARDVGSLDW